MRKAVLTLAFAILLGIAALFAGRAQLGWNNGMTYPRSEIHAAVLDDTLYVVGGIGLFRVLDACESYNIAEAAWGQCPPLPRPLHHVAMAADESRVYASGGYVALPFEQDQDPALFALTPGAKAWKEISKLPQPIGQHAMIHWNGSLYLVGGQSGPTDLGTIWAYDITANRWTEMAQMPTPRHSHAIALAGDKLYISGGRSAELGTEIDHVEVYDLTTNQWERLPSMPTGRAGHGAFVDAGRLHVIGGESLTEDRVIASHEILDLTSGLWSSGVPMQSPRHGHAVAQSPKKGEVFIVGGGARPGLQTIYSVTGTLQTIEWNSPKKHANKSGQANGESGQR